METEVEKREITIQRLNKAQFGGLSIYPKSVTVLSTEMGRDKLYKTGLTDEEERKFEKILGLSEGKLKRNSTFWAELSIRIGGKSLKLDLDNPLDYLKYKVCLESSKIANSIVDKSKWPDAMFVIYDEEEEAKKENIKISAKRKAYARFGTMAHEEMRSFAKIIGKKRPENTSNEVVENIVATFVETDPTQFLAIMADQRFEAKVLAEDLLSAGLIHKAGNYYKNGDEIMGHTMDEVADYLTDEKNQQMVIAFKKRLKKK